MTQDIENSVVLQAVQPDRLSFDELQSESGNPARVEFDLGHRRNLFLLLVLILLLLITWSWFTELDQIAQAPGQLIPSEQIQPIRAVYNSRILKVLVKPGDRVKRGDLLIRLDTKTFAAELEKYRSELKIAERELERHEHAFQVLNNFMQNPELMPADQSSVTAVAKALGDHYSSLQRLKRAERDMRKDNFPDLKKTSEFAALRSQHQSINEQLRLKQLSLAERRKHFLLEEEKVSRKVEMLEKEQDLQKTAVEQRQFSLECTQKQLAAYEKVFASGASSKTECLDARMRVEDRQKDLTTAETKAREIAGQLESARHELAQLRSRNSMQGSQLEASVFDIAASEAQVSSRMRTAERNLSDAQTNYQVALRATRSTFENEQAEIARLKKEMEQLIASISAEEHIYHKGELCSPVDGTVALLHLHGDGEVVQQGQDLLTIVPSKQELLVCLHVPNEQIAFIHKNDKIKLQFPAYPYQQYGTVSARVKIVDEFPSQEKDYASTYRVLLEPLRNWILCRGRKISLRKGLEVEAQIVMRKRRLLVVLLAPLLKLQYVHFKA